MLDNFRHGRTIKEWIEVDVKWQLKEYIEGPEVKKSVEDGLVLRASIVVVIGSRHILLWDMIKGELAAKPVLLGDKLVKETTSVGLPQKVLEKPVLPGDRLVKKVASVSIEPVPKKASEKPKPVKKVLKKLQRKCGICGKPGHNKTTCPSKVGK